jgi:TetR/AcrR family transcriptional regulator
LQERILSEVNLNHQVAGADQAHASPGRQRLLAAAAETFSLHGYAGASISAIAARAGVSKSTIFHHFDSKESLYLAVIQEAAAEFGQTLDQVLDVSRDAYTSLAEFQLAHLEHLNRNRQVASLVLRELRGEGPGETAERVSRVVAVNFARLVEFLAALQTAGRIRGDADPEAAALAMLSINAFAFQIGDALLALPGLNVADDPKRFAAAITDLVFHGLHTERAEGKSDE